jgi:hypothetical protein
VLSAADEIIAAGGQIVVTGRGETQFEEALVEAHRRRPDAIGVDIGFDDGDARRIFAGSDFTLMPSRFEPCGLSQMYAQRFGSLPIGHQTGGLAETIVDGETGFLFTHLNRVVSRRHPPRVRDVRRRIASTRCAAAPCRSHSAGTFPQPATARFIEKQYHLSAWPCPAAYTRYIVSCCCSLR